MGIKDTLRLPFSHRSSMVTNSPAASVTWNLLGSAPPLSPLVVATAALKAWVISWKSFGVSLLWGKRKKDCWSERASNTQALKHFTGTGVLEFILHLIAKIAPPYNAKEKCQGGVKKCYWPLLALKWASRAFNWLGVEKQWISCKELSNLTFPSPS